MAAPYVRSISSSFFFMAVWGNKWWSQRNFKRGCKLFVTLEQGELVTLRSSGAMRDYLPPLNVQMHVLGL